MQKLSRRIGLPAAEVQVLWFLNDRARPSGRSVRFVGDNSFTGAILKRVGGGGILGDFLGVGAKRLGG